MTKGDTSTIIEKYGIEWLILETCITDFTGNNNGDYFCELIRQHSIDWGKLFDHAFRQKIAPMLVHRIMQNGLLRYCPSYLYSYLRLLLDYNQRRTQIYKAEACRISEALSENNIRFVCTKGIVLEDELYESGGYRALSDIDFIVHPTQQKEVMNILNKLGYQMGIYNWEQRKSNTYTREQYLRYIVTGNKIPNHYLVLDNHILPCVYTGFDMSLTWTGFPYEVNIDDALSHSVEYQIKDIGKSIFTFDICYHFMYIALHLIKHAWSEYLQLSSNDCNLSQFCDLIWYWNKHEEYLRQNLLEVINAQKVLEPVLWVLAHADLTFGTDILKKLCCENEISQNWLSTTISKSGKYRILDVSMREKLWLVDKNKAYKNMT